MPSEGVAARMRVSDLGAIVVVEVASPGYCGIEERLGLLIARSTMIEVAREQLRCQVCSNKSLVVTML